MPAAKLRQKAFRDLLIKTFSGRGKGRVWAKNQLDIYWNGRDIAWRLSYPSDTPVQVARFESLEQTTHDALLTVASAVRPRNQP
jgi:hypothetical protein